MSQELVVREVSSLLPQNLNPQHALEIQARFDSSVAVQAFEAQTDAQLFRCLREVNSMTAMKSLGLRFVVKQSPKILDNTVEVCARYISFILKDRGDFGEVEMLLLLELITEFSQKPYPLYIDDIICLIKKGLTGGYGKLFHTKLTLDVVGDWFVQYADEIKERHQAIIRKQKIKPIPKVKFTPEQEAKHEKRMQKFYEHLKNQEDKYKNVPKQDRDSAQLARTNLIKFRYVFPERVPLWQLQSQLDNTKLSEDERDELRGKIDTLKSELKS